VGDSVVAAVSGKVDTAARDSGQGGEGLLSGERRHGVISVARDTQAGVELFRGRLTLWLGIITTIAISFYASANILGVVALGRTWAEQRAHPGNWVCAVQAPLMVGLWIVCAVTRPSLRMLEAIDVGASVMLCLVSAFLSYLSPSSAHPGLDLGLPPSSSPPVGVISNIGVLSLRAALLPSTPRRTLIISLASTAPILLVAYLVQRRFLTAQATSFAVSTALVALAVIPIPVLISGAIYSLGEQVREATRLGQYILEEKIGEGGMGMVYRARHALLRRATAIKLLLPERTGAVGLARFEREVQQTSQLTHPHTVAIYDYGHTADGVFYYAMEYLDGLSLEELGQHDGPQPPGRVVHILSQVCGALAEAHSRGLIHRDIKPANLHLCVRGDIADYVKVLDFGLAKELVTDLGQPQLSVTGVFLGTPLYVAPEAIARPNEVDGRADLYALGAVAYYLLTGTPPFQAPSIVEVCSKHLYMEPEAPSQRLGSRLPPALEALVLQCLDKDPDRRPASAADLGRALAGCTDVLVWTEADAADWWRARSGAVLELAVPLRRTGISGSAQKAVAVDLHDRGHAGPQRRSGA
jgi:hypothetical protein